MYLAPFLFVLDAALDLPEPYQSIAHRLKVY
jgi:hypothetical protein